MPDSVCDIGLVYMWCVCLTSYLLMLTVKLFVRVGAWK